MLVPSKTFSLRVPSIMCSQVDTPKIFSSSFTLPLETDFLQDLLNMMLCAIWYEFYDLKNVENTNGGVELLETSLVTTLLKVTFLHGCLSRFFIGTKSRKASLASRKL